MDKSVSETDPRATHARAIKSTHTEVSLYNNLITLYSKSDFRSYPLSLFHQIKSPNVVTWTALICAHTNTPHALHHFISMLRYPILPNQRTLASLLKTCASLLCLSFGLQLHSLSLKLFLSPQPFVGSSLTNFYAKLRLPNEAIKVFDEMPHSDEVCYSALVVGLAQNRRSIDALSVFSEMRVRGIGSTLYSISGALSAAADVAALEQCRMLHAHAFVSGFESNVIVNSALVDGYGKCGLVIDARQVFDEFVMGMNLVGWNAMLSCYAQQGDKNSALELFDRMVGRGFVPDEYSFLAIVTSLANSGLVVEIKEWFKKMSVEYGLEPKMEHYTCLIGAMGHAGRLEEAERVALTMPFAPDTAVWRALLSACALHGEPDMAWKMGKRLLELDPKDDSAYVIAANVFAGKGRWDEVAEVRSMMKERRVRKEGGRSWVEVRGMIHVFFAGDRSHERREEIYAELSKLMKKIEELGYVPIWNEVLHEAEERRKKEALWRHSEKLALAFALICGAAPPGKAIRIVKNLKICKDCHEAFRYISRVVEREIIVRDMNRYHTFANGGCSCGGHW
ncbi:DYW domain [Dillenia turbinata]|uniref:DYW domain n=1 Tax=Dillenia turbinata TaxID=194707 RepID=A0AAN8YVC5_9MAGN